MIKAKKGDIVMVHCTAKLEDGTVFVSTKDHKPLKFTLGEGSVLENVEKAVIGMNPGESKTTEIPVEKAFQPPWKVVEIERYKFPDWEPKLGQRLKIFKPDGRLIAARVSNVSDSMVALDFRRTFSGDVLLYDLKLEEIV
ncbi:MAG: FKBP-type peptidyl-prolyl cis-trans isomerase [Nitrospirota bacterium]